jgi:hypothetical protein
MAVQPAHAELVQMSTMWVALAYCHECDLHMSVDLTRVDDELIAPVPVCQCGSGVSIVTVVQSDSPTGRSIDTFVHSGDYVAWHRAARALTRAGILPQ